jgi:hypothetical protein
MAEPRKTSYIRLLRDAKKNASEAERQEIFNFLMSDLFNTVTEDEVFSAAGKNIYIRGVVLSEKERMSVASSAQNLQHSAFFRQLVAEMKYAANKRMYASSESYEDMKGGKWMLHAIDVMEKKIANLARLVV